MGFNGYKRPDGSCGVRNHVLVISSVSCANGVVNAISRDLPEIKPITHAEGCGRGLPDVEVTKRTVVGLCRNPNVAAILVVGLGCEFMKAPQLAEELVASGKPVESLVIQDEGGSRKTTTRGVRIAKEMLSNAAGIRQEECGWDRLVVGLECGGSDALSGITANPLVGKAADWLVGEGATVILSETTEMIGTEDILSKRAASPEIGKQVFDLIKGQKKFVKDELGPFADLVISPGNIEGGLSNITEKSLGCIIKAGTSAVQEVIEYGACPSKKGLVIMDTPGSDIFSLTGMAAGGSQIMIFTTGRGTPAGFPIVPVVKVASNSELFINMEDDMDVNAGRLLEGVSMEAAAEEFIGLIKRVSDGEQPRAEFNRQDCLAIHTVGSAF